MKLFLWVSALILWAALIVGGLTLVGVGLDLTLVFKPTGDALRGVRVGKLLILAGSASVIAAAFWGWRMRIPIWVCAFVAAPAVLTGGLSLLLGDSLLPQLSALGTFPAAGAGLIFGLILARPLMRAGLPHGVPN